MQDRWKRSSQLMERIGTNWFGPQDQGGDDPGEEVGVHFVRVFSGDSVGFWIP